jgi:ABC-2 type transport system ATP-binding protein
VANEPLTPAVEVRDLHVRRGPHRALRGLTLDVPAGTITGLLGPSGSGKTTLMRTVVGTQVVTSGAVTVLGLPAGDPALRRRVGYMTQDASVYGDLTVAENARYFATVAGRTAEHAARAVDVVGLAARAGQRVDTLSGGERNRVSLACALVGGPDLLVLDEPTVGLDPVLRADLWSTFADLRDDGVTILVSSHVMNEADRCERLVLLRDGELLGQFTPTGLREAGGTDDPDAAFLALVRARAARAGRRRREG